MPQESPQDQPLAVITVDPRKKFGEVYTPDAIAEFMAGLFDFPDGEPVRLLDPGAGGGVLAEHVLARISDEPPSEVIADLVEINTAAWVGLSEDVKDWTATWANIRPYNADFLEFAADPERAKYTHIVMNPPYVKIGSTHPAQGALTGTAVSVPNLYAAFLWLATDLLANRGQMVAILPRSFFNGTTFRKLRTHLNANLVVTHVHSFRKRGLVFSRDRVLQETVIVKFVKRASPRGSVQVSWSNGGDAEDLMCRAVPYAEVVGADGVLSVPDEESDQSIVSDGVHLFGDLFSVSTGQVVDFRTKEVTDHAEPGCVPLVDSNYGSLALRPRTKDGRRYLRRTPATESLVLPVGNYVVIKRVSPKEQSPRIRAALVSAEELEDAGGVAFENHVNFVHKDRGGLTYEEALRVLSHLASSEVEAQFRRRSGTTQVNLSDLRALLIPVD